MTWTTLLSATLLLSVTTVEAQTVDADRPRARDVGVVIGALPTGPLNSITDVGGVLVGHSTVADGDRVQTGVTAIRPHGGNLFRDRVPAAIYTANGFGKLLGVTQVYELGEIETPILLTCTLCVWRAADAMVEWLLSLPDMENVNSINPVVGETNDGGLNDIRARPILPEHVVAALESAGPGPVAEGSVGAGAGTRAFGFKGGIGTSSRRSSDQPEAFTVGVLVQSNFGGSLTIGGVPVQRELRDQVAMDAPDPSPDGSIMIVVATDAPLSDRNLQRLALRAVTGLSRTGSAMSNGSGDYVIAFSTAASVRRPRSDPAGDGAELSNNAMSSLFVAVAEATEEAIINSLFAATSVTNSRGSAEALPIERTLEILRRHGALQPAAR
jgi:D-aminopeptidase